MLLRRLIACALAVAAALALAACGGGDDEGGAYRADVAAVIDKLEKDSAAINQRVVAEPTPEGKLRAFTELNARYEEAADALARIEPPDDARADHDRLVDQLRGLRDNLAALEKAARREDRDAHEQAIAELTAELNAAQQTANQLEQR